MFPILDLIKPPFDPATLDALAAEIDGAEQVEITTIKADPVGNNPEVWIERTPVPASGARDPMATKLVNLRLQDLGRVAKALANAGHEEAATKLELARGH